MVCPKCNEGFLQKIILKKNQEHALVCDFCETIWFQEENKNEKSGHRLKAYEESENKEYTFDKEEKNDEFKRE